MDAPDAIWALCLINQHVKGTNLKSRPKTQNIAPSKPSSYARIAEFPRNHASFLIFWSFDVIWVDLHIHNSHLNDKTWLNVWPFQVAAGSSILSTSWARESVVLTSDVATVVTVSTSGGVAASSWSSWRLCENIPPLSQEQLQEDELLIILLVLQSNWKNLRFFGSTCDPSEHLELPGTVQKEWF